MSVGTDAPRPSVVAGRWYPDDPAELARLIDTCLVEADGDESPPALLLVPHAGLAYSGPVAGHAYARLRSLRPARVFVIGQSHRHHTGVELYDPTPIGTPLGPVPIDAAAAAALREQMAPHGPRTDETRAEHALEVQFPFLRRVVPDVPVVPVVVTIGSVAVWTAVCVALEATGLLDDSIVVLSTDLYHGYDRQQCERQAAHFARLLEAGDRAAVEDAWRREEATVCGHGPVLIGLDLAGRMGRAWRVLRLATSADVVPDSDWVVGYAAAVA